MKYVFFLILALAVLMAGCKSQEMAPVDEVAVVPDPEPVPEPEPEPEPIRVEQERFDFDTTEDQVTHDENTYFVIVGSFIQRDNADRFVGTLRNQGFSPVILLSETGFNRVSVDSFDEEAPARARIMQIRRTYPDYHDTWLLIRRP